MAVVVVAAIARCWVLRGCSTLSTLVLVLVWRQVLALGAGVVVAVDAVAIGIHHHRETTSSIHPVSSCSQRWWCWAILPVSSDPRHPVPLVHPVVPIVPGAVLIFPTYHTFVSHCHCPPSPFTAHTDPHIVLFTCFPPADTLYTSRPETLPQIEMKDPRKNEHT